MASDKKLEGILMPMPVAFKADGAIDHSATDAIIDFYLASGVHGFFPLGTHGQGMVMEIDERKKVAEQIVNRVRGRVPVVMHIGTANTYSSIELAKHAAGLGVDAIGVVPPYYYPHDDYEVYAHYKAIAKSSIYTMSDPPNIARALSCGSLNDVMYLLQSGRVDLGFIGGAEVDRFANLNTHWVADNDRRTRLPGSGGAADIATMARRCIIIMNHERRRFVPKVHYVTSPGYGEGGAWRATRGLSGGGPSRVITSMGIFSFDAESREMILSWNHPGVRIEDIKAQTGWPLRVSLDIAESQPPTRDELEAVRKYDPKGVWTS